MSRWSSFTLQSRAMNSLASQSSSSGWVGSSPNRPKSFGVRTIPRPKWCWKIRFAITRAVNGCDGSVSQRANARRRPDVVPSAVGAISGVPPPRIIGNPARTSAPFVFALPRTRTKLGAISAPASCAQSTVTSSRVGGASAASCATVCSWRAASGAPIRSRIISVYAANPSPSRARSTISSAERTRS